MGSFMALGNEDDVWQIQTDQTIYEGLITNSRTDNDGYPIMIEITERATETATTWVPFREVRSLRNITQAKARAARARA